MIFTMHLIPYTTAVIETIEATEPPVQFAFCWIDFQTEEMLPGEAGQHVVFAAEASGGTLHVKPVFLSESLELRESDFIITPDLGSLVLCITNRDNGVGHAWKIRITANKPDIVVRSKLLPQQEQPDDVIDKTTGNQLRRAS